MADPALELRLAHGPWEPVAQLVERGRLIAQTDVSRMFRVLHSSAADRWEATDWDDLTADEAEVTLQPDGGLLWQADRFGGLDVRVSARAQLKDGEVLWTFSVENDSAGTVAGLVGPTLEKVNLGGNDMMLLPNRPGTRLDNCWELLKAEPFELGYPVPASMQFLVGQGNAAALALHVFDVNLDHKLLSVGGSGRQITVQHHPFVEPGGAWTGPPVLWQALENSWHAAADRYRAWFRTWAAPPQIAPQVAAYPTIALEVVKSRPVDDLDIPDVLASMESGSYQASTSRVRKLRSQGFTGVELVGWFGGGHDTTLPDYDATEELGGAQGLRELVKAAHDDELLVALYLNLRLCNMNSATYLANPGWRLLTQDGEPVSEEYGDQSFHVMCPSASGWQQHMTSVVRSAIADWDADGVQFDQVGAAKSVLCFDRAHGHATPATAWRAFPVWLRELRDLVRSIRPSAWTWIEGAWDAAGPWVDIAQGGFWEDVEGSTSEPEFYRYTLPEHPQFGDAGMAGVPYWCPTDVHRARAVYDRVGEMLAQANFLDTQGIDVEPGVQGRLFVGEGHVLVTVASPGPGPVTVRLDRAWLPPGEPGRARAVVAEIDVDVSSGTLVTLSGIPLPEGEVEVVTLEWHPIPIS